MGYGRGRGDDDDGNSCAKALHIFFSVCLLLAGGALLGLSIWAYTDSSYRDYQLNWTGSTKWNNVTDFAIIGIVFGSLIIVLSIFAFLSLINGCCGAVFKIIYMIGLIASIIALIIAGVYMLIFATSDNPSGLESFLQDTWVNSVTEPAYVNNTCNIQVKYTCMGFNQNDCVNADTTTNPISNATAYQRQNCPFCPAWQVPIPQSWTNQGCYQAFLDEAQKLYLPAGIVCIVVAALGLLDSFLIWCA